MPVAMASNRMMYVRDIPVSVRQKLCDVFDDMNALKTWRQLAGLLGFNNDDIAMFQRSLYRPGGSPTDDMLTTWDYENHTIEELYLKLYELKHARCMMYLKDYVRQDLHYLIQKITNSDPVAVLPEPPVPNAGQPVNQVQPGMANIPLCPENQFARSVSPRPQQMNPSSFQQSQQYPQIQNQQQQQQYQQYWEQQSSGRTPQQNSSSTASYHSNQANHGFHPVDPKMMVPTRSPQPRYNASQQPNNYRQEYQGQQQQQQQQQQGNNLMRMSSERPIGGPQRYQSQHSSEDNMALPPPASPAFLASVTQPVFHSNHQLNTSQHGTPSRESSVEQCLEATIEVPYDKLRKATEDFSAARKLGAGAFGEVFHAQLNMIDVAIKKVIKNDNVKFKQSMIRADQIKEIEALTKYRHKNIVCLTAYSIGVDCLCLIFDYMKNGSLDYQLEGKSPHGPLDWQRRHKIAEGAAMGIQYLHTAQSTPLIHQDIKSANILLDEHFVPKIADFGLARPGPRNGKEYTTIKTSVVFGTKAYLAPEFIRDPKRKLSKKLDVYSFGIVLMELVTGAKAGQAKQRFETNELLWKCVEKIMDSNEGNPQQAAVKLQDPNCPDWPVTYMTELLQLAVKCTDEFKRRPEMETVIHTLSEMGVRIEEEEKRRSSRTHNDPVENTDPLERGKAVESSDPSQTSDSQDHYGANGFQRWDGGCKDEIPKYNYGGYQALADGPKVQGNMNNERPHVQESTHQAPERRLDRVPERNQMKEGVGHEMCARERQIQDQQLAYYNQDMYEQMMYAQAVATSGNSSMEGNPAPSQSSMSHSPGSSYPSCLQSSSITSSSNASEACYQGLYPQGYYPGQHHGQYGNPVDPRLRHMPDQNLPYQIRPGFHHRADSPYGHYQHHGQYPRFGHFPQGPQNVVYHQQTPLPNPQPDTRDQIQQGLEQFSIKGSADSTTQKENLVARTPPVSTASSAGSSSSSSNSRYPEYPKMPTIHLGPLSTESSDTSNYTRDTSLSESSKDLPQNADGGDSRREESGQREQIGMLQSGRDQGTEQSNEAPRREPDENTEPQTQPCL